MAKFRKRPVVIEATQWHQNGDHPEDGQETLLDITGKQHRMEGKVVRYYRSPNDPGTRTCEHCDHKMHVHGWIDTMEGGHIVCPSDWIITGILGERYPCKHAVFLMTYEPV